MTTHATPGHGASAGSAQLDSPHAPHGRFTAFRSPAFRFLWANSCAFQLGLSIQRFAYVWLVLDLGGSSRAAGLVAFALGIPVFVFAVPAGSLADRADKRLLLIGSQVGALVVSGGTAWAIWAGEMSIPLAYGFAAALGAVTAFGQPIRTSIVPALVDRPALMNAIVMMSLGTNVTLIVGPALGGAAIDLGGIGGAFAVTAVLCAVGLTALVPLRLPPRRASVEEVSGGGFRTGIAFIARTPGVRSLFVMLTASSLLLIGPYQAIVPLVARERLHADALSASLLFTVLGVGTLVASLLLAWLKTLPDKGAWFLVALGVMGLGMAGMGLSPWYAVTMVVMLLWGIGGGVYMNLNQTLVQSNTPLDLMGRVMSVYTVTLMGLGPVGGLVAGAAAGVVGAPAWAAVCGIALAVAAALSFVFQPSLRRLA